MTISEVSTHLTREPRPLGLFERLFVWPIKFIARVIAMCIAYFLWLFVGIVWFALLIRTMASFGWATVVNLFSGKDPPDEARLDYIASFWIRGFGDIVAAFSRNTSVNAILPRPQFNPWQELAIACVFYLWMITTLAFLGHWLAFVAWAAEWSWYIITVVGWGVLNLLRRIPYFPI
jgi:hypothetical protein